MSGTEFETIDVAGSTKHFNGSVGTTAINIPSVADKVIQSVAIKNVSNPTRTLQIKLDPSGSDFWDLANGDALIWTPKGYAKQFQIKSVSANSDYQILVNFEDF